MKKCMIACFWGILILPNLLSLLLPSARQEENTEKRDLAGLPVFSAKTLDEYPRQLESFINDHAPFRSWWLDVYAAANLKLFDSIDSREVINGKEGWLFYTGNESVDDYIGANLFSPGDLEGILEQLLMVRDKYAGAGEFVFLIPPNKESVYSRYMPDYYKKTEGINKSAQLVNYIRANSDIKVIFPLEELIAQGREGLIYYKTDTHWNDAGGFIAAQDLIEATGGERTDINDAGVTYEKAGPGDLADLFHMPDRYCEDYEAVISSFHDGPGVEGREEGPWLKTRFEGAPDPRRLVMIRDSFGTALAATLSRYYVECAYIDWRQAGPEVLEQEQGDIFVYELVERNLGRIGYDLEQFLNAGPQ